MRAMMTRALTAVTLVGAGGLALWAWQGPPTAQAQDGAATDALRLAETASLDKTAYLKRLSLDVRGHVPQWEEYAALDEAEDVPEALIDDMLDSEGFREVMRHYHRDLLWANVSTIQYIQFHWDLARVNVTNEGQTHLIHYMRRRSAYYRGGPDDPENVSIPCGGWEATFDEDGRPETVCDDETGRCLEGWVWVEPYWEPGTEVKVCAFDAQEAEVGEGGVACGSRGSRRETTCGCGPNLAYCDAGFGVNVQLTVGESLAEQMLEVIDWVIREDRPYHEILTTRRSFLNGPLAHYFRHQLDLAANVTMTPSPLEGDFLPDIAWNDPSWVPVLQGEEHSGILTSYAFLLRFQTNRGRVNQFYNAFLDSYFDASKGVNSPDCVESSGDLTKMCGCQKCHVAVEPWAAYWARWKQQGGGYLDPARFPLYDDDCRTCAEMGIGTCPNHCRQEYVLQAVPAEREPYVGYLRGYEFLKEQHQVHAEAGPRLWVERTLQDGSLAEGVVSKMWVHFMRRPFDGGKADTEIRRQLVFRFMESGYDIKALVKAIVTHPTYRRIR